MGERNSKIDILKGLGIIFVVLGHCGQSTGVTVFAPYSFHMPLFIFCSGYFFDENKKGNIQTIVKYLKKMILPLIIVGGIYYFIGALVNGTLFDQIRYRAIGTAIAKEVLLAAFLGTYGNNIFMTACWFVGCLFWIRIYFQFIHTRLVAWAKNKVIIQTCLLLFYIIASLMAINYALGAYENNGRLSLAQIVILRVAFGSFFYYLGFIIRTYLQDWIKKHRWEVLFSSHVVMSILYQSGIGLDFWMDRMLFQKNGLPVLTGVLGILFFYIIADLWSENGCKLLEQIGRSSMSILLHHLFIMYVINCILHVMGLISQEELKALYFRYEVNYMWPVYCLTGLLVPLLLIRVKGWCRRFYCIFRAD